MAGEFGKAQQDMDTAEAAKIVERVNSQDPRVAHSASLLLYNDLQMLSGLPQAPQGTTEVPDLRSVTPPVPGVQAADLIGAVEAYKYSDNSPLFHVSKELTQQNQDTGVRDVILTRPDNTSEVVWRYTDQNAGQVPQVGYQGPPVADTGVVQQYGTGLPATFDGNFDDRGYGRFDQDYGRYYGSNYNYDNLGIGYDYGPQGQQFYDPGVVIEFNRSGSRNYGEFMRRRHQQQQQGNFGSTYGNGTLANPTSIGNPTIAASPAARTHTHGTNQTEALPGAQTTQPVISGQTARPLYPKVQNNGIEGAPGQIHTPATPYKAPYVAGQQTGQQTWLHRQPSSEALPPANGGLTAAQIWQQKHSHQPSAVPAPMEAAPAPLRQAPHQTFQGAVVPTHVEKVPAAVLPRPAAPVHVEPAKPAQPVIVKKNGH